MPGDEIIDHRPRAFRPFHLEPPLVRYPVQVRGRARLMFGVERKPEERDDSLDFLRRPGEQVLVVDVAPIRAAVSLTDA